MGVNWPALVVCVAIFGFITWLGFAASRWGAPDLNVINEWGLGGRRFGTLITWCLMGGDFFSASAMVAFPALVFGAGALGAFGIPYCIFIFITLFLIGPRLWAVAQKHDYVTSADFVQGRFGNRWLALAIAATSFIAIMPYIALQLVGMQVVIAAMGLQTSGLVGHVPLLIAFIVLAGFTYTSGLRGPAAISVVKDALLYITGIAALVAIPAAMGGYGHIFNGVPPGKLTLPIPGHNTLGLYSSYVTLALIGPIGLMLYPHSVTAMLSAKNTDVIKRNAILMPIYTIIIGLMITLGYMALVSGVAQMPEFAAGFKEFGTTYAVPALFLHFFPAWFAGVTFAALVLGALVPASIMSVGAANVFTRNIYRAWCSPNCTQQREAQVAKWVSFLIKFGALLIVFVLPNQYMVNFQLIGTICMIQALPAVMLGLFMRWFDSWALLIGWAAGIISGIVMESTIGFKGSIFPLKIGDFTLPGYVAAYSLLVNIVVAVVVTALAKIAVKATILDETSVADYA